MTPPRGVEDAAPYRDGPQPKCHFRVFFFQIQYSPSSTSVSRYTISVAHAVRTLSGSVLAMAWVLKLERAHAVSFLPKSVTTAIGMDVAETLGGTAALAGAVIILTGIVGSLLGETVCKVCRITNPLAKGLALGTSAHAIGTSKALQMGEIEGAMSGLAIAVAGIMTAILAPVAANFLP